MSKNRENISFYRVIVAALLASSMVFHLAILWESRHQMAAGYGDFIIFYTGAQIINDGKSKELFNIETQNAYQAKFDVPQLEWPLPFNHAPYELVLFMPLAHLPYPVAHAIWSGMNIIFLVIMLRLLLPGVQSQQSFLIGAALLAWFPTMETLRLGQDSIMSTLLLLAAFVNLKRQRDAWAGFFLALGLYKPQLVLPMVGALLVARRWNFLAMFSITGVVLIAVSLAMVGWQGALDLLSILKSMDSYSFIVRPAIMPNLRGFIYLLLDGTSLKSLNGGITLVISAGLYLLCLYLWRRKLDVLDPEFDLKFSLTIVTTILISFHLYPHDLFPLTVPLILFFRYVSSSGASRRAAANSFLILLILLFFPLVPRYLIQAGSFGWGASAVVLLYIVIGVEILKRDISTA